VGREPRGGLRSAPCCLFAGSVQATRCDQAGQQGTESIRIDGPGEIMVETYALAVPLVLFVAPSP
jgi:hypothetical protein